MYIAILEKYQYNIGSSDNKIIKYLLLINIAAALMFCKCLI